LTKRFLPAFATAVVTTKMINSQEQGSPETPQLMVVLLASSAGQSAPATPVNLGRPAESGEQPTRIRSTIRGGGRIRRGILPADHRARAGQQLVLIIIAPLALA
jgi:hypothetical protein